MTESTTDSEEMEGLESLAEFVPYIGYAIKAYGVYQELFGPAQHTLSWEKILRASEKRIIDAVKKELFTTKLSDLRGVAAFWEDISDGFLNSNPISPANVTAFEHYVHIATLNDTISKAEQLASYFADVPQEYATFAALATVHNLLFTLVTTREAYYVAALGRLSGGHLLSNHIQRAIEIMQKWGSKYLIEREKYVSHEIEEVYSGPAGAFGGGRQKHVTGWHILHDSAPDPATGSLEGVRYNRIPIKSVELAERYWKSELALNILPKLLLEWALLKDKAVASETLPAINTKMWYRLKSLASEPTSIDVVNRTDGGFTDAQLQLVPEGNYSGQFWQFRPSSTAQLYWNLSTLFKGKGLCLDVYGDDKTLPHLATAGNYSGQQWKLVNRNNGAWSLSNAYCGENMLLTNRINPNGSMRLTLSPAEENSVTQMWKLSPIREITEW